MPVGEMPPSVKKLLSSAASTAFCRFFGICWKVRSCRLTVPNVPMTVLPSL